MRYRIAWKKYTRHGTQYLRIVDGEFQNWLGITGQTAVEFFEKISSENPGIRFAYDGELVAQIAREMREAYQ